MSNEVRVRANLVSGTLSVALAAGDTTMSSAGLANLPAIASTQHAVVVVENEVIFVTAHTAAATTATILRAQEGTSAAPHGLNVAWVHGAVVSDYDSVLGRATVTANQGSITTEVDLTSLTTTVTVPYSGHLVKITARCLANSTIADDVIALLIYEDGIQIQQHNVPQRVASWAMGLEMTTVKVPTSGSHTYKLRMRRDTGTGTITMQAAATFPAFILVEDLGPAL